MPDRAVSLLLHGIIALLLSLLMWKITHSMVGWLALFIPGAVMVIGGWYVALKRKN